MCATAALGNGATPPGDAVLVKEVFHAATGKMKTGTVSHAEMLKGWFVMVKDSKGRYAGNKLWGGAGLGLMLPTRQRPIDRLQNGLSTVPRSGAGF